jgi:hypothetical protein
VSAIDYVRPCTLAEYRVRRIQPLRGAVINMTEEEQKKRGAEARKRLQGTPPKLKTLHSKIPEVIEAVRFFVTSCEEIPEEKPPVDNVNNFWQQRRKTWKDIVNEVCDKHGVSFEELISARRHMKIVYARQEAFWRFKNETTMSLPQMAKRLNRCDHSMSLHSIRRYEARQKQGLPDVYPEPK